MTRPSFDEIYGQMAKLMAQRSTCRRLKVGAVITSTDYRYVYGIGFNGNAAGLPNDCDSDEVGKCGCIHAEANAVINCTVARTVPKYVFCTDLPCVGCAKVLINLGAVERVYYARDYRIKDSLALFERVGIKTIGPRICTCRITDQIWECRITDQIWDPECLVHGKDRPGQGSGPLKVLEKAEDIFNAHGVGRRFAYTRDGNMNIRGCVLVCGTAAEACRVCHGDCPDKERFK